MITQNINHGRESEEHRALKAEALQCLKNLGFGFVLCERQNCDLLGARKNTDAVLAVEIERSSRNLRRNIYRDLASGCAQIVIVCPNFKVTAEIARKLDRELSPGLREKVGVITASALRMIAPPQS